MAPPSEASSTKDTLKHQSSNSSIASKESDPSVFSDYGLQRSLQRPYDSDSTHKDVQYILNLEEHGVQLFHLRSDAQEALQTAWQARFDALSRNDAQEQMALDSAYKNAHMKRVDAEHELRKHNQHTDVLRALPPLTRAEIRAVMSVVDTAAMANLEDTTSDVERTVYLFRTLSGWKQDLAELRAEVTSTRDAHDEDFEKLVQAHDDLEDARTEISDLKEALQGENKLTKVLKGVVDAENDNDRHRQTMNLQGLLSKTRADYKKTQSELNACKKELSESKQQLEMLKNPEDAVPKLTTANKVLCQEMEYWRGLYQGLQDLDIGE